MIAVQCRNVTKSYRSRQVLEKLNFEIKENTFTGIIGRNGVGKTTIMRMIAGFTDVSEGKLEVFAENPFNSLKVSSNVIFIDDQMTFPDNMTIQDILKECSRFYHRWDQQFALRLLKHFSLHLKTKPYVLSKGKKNTFHAIIGIASRSPLTIFDEPTTGMDAVVRKDFYRALLKDYIAHPRTILLSSHHIEEIEHLLEDALLIHDQNKLFHGSITDLQEMFVTAMGSDEQLAHYFDNNQVVARQEMGPYQTLTIKNSFSQSDIEKMKADGIRVATVSANDAYVALTGKSKGGIDDVFA